VTGAFGITRARTGPAIVLRLQGALSASSTSALIEELGQLLEQPAVLIDVRAVGELDDLALATMTEYLTRAARHGPAFAFLTERDSRIDEALDQYPNTDAIPVLRSTAQAVETVVGLTLYGERPIARKPRRQANAGLTPWPRS
jgi:anti-anti-sigma regulatory factor